MNLVEPPRRSTRIAIAAAAAASIAALLLNARHYFPFISDDAFISLRYAERLLGGEGLTWTAGPPVEGYTNLLWTLLCAALGAVGADLVLAARILGLLGMGAAAVAISWAVRPRGIAEVAAAFAVMLGFALSGPAGAWVVGGLEQPLLAGLLAWAIATCAPLLGTEPVAARRVLVPGLLLALVALTRADGAVLVAGACLGVLLLHRLRSTGWRRALLLAALPLAAFLAQLAFRLVYYGDWVPNSALVKVAFTADRLRGGAGYVLAAAASSALLIALAAVPLIVVVRARDEPRWRLAAFAWTVGLVWAAYVVFIGGDIFPAHRHWIPTLVALGIAAASGLCLVLARWPRFEWAAVAVALLASIGNAALQRGDRENHRAVTERWEYNGESVGRLLRRAFGDREPLLAAAAVGSLCYYSKLPSLDMLGLNDRHIARRRPPEFGTGFIGHELGDGAYAMSRRPDLVVFCGPTGRLKPCSLGEVEMMALPEFRTAYQMVVFRTTGPRQLDAHIWVRRQGSIGIQAGPDRVAVPGYLLSARDARAQLDAEGRIGLRLPARSPARVQTPLGAGRWRVRIESDATSGLALAATSAGRPIERSASGEIAFELDGETAARGPVGLEVRATAPTHVRRLVIERRD